MTYKIVRSKNLNVFKDKMEIIERMGYFPQWQSFSKDDGTYMIFMVKL